MGKGGKGQASMGGSKTEDRGTEQGEEAKSEEGMGERGGGSLEGACPAYQVKQLNIHRLCVFGESIQEAPQGLTVKKGHGQQQNMVQQPGMHLLCRTVTAPYGDKVAQHTSQHDREGERGIDLEVMSSSVGMSCCIDVLKRKRERSILLTSFVQPTTLITCDNHDFHFVSFLRCRQTTCSSEPEDDCSKAKKMTCKRTDD